MPKETQIEILFDELKKIIGVKYENMKGFKVAPMREIDIVDYLSNLYFHGIDDITNVKDIITEWELVPFKSDIEIQVILYKIRELRK